MLVETALAGSIYSMQGQVSERFSYLAGKSQILSLSFKLDDVMEGSGKSLDAPSWTNPVTDTTTVPFPGMYPSYPTMK